MVGLCVSLLILLDTKQCIRCNTPYIEYTSENSSGHNFVFDSVFDEKSSQEDIFDAFGKDITENCLNGYNGCIFAYGQTGSGKTHTILGPSSPDGTLVSDSKLLGLLPRTLAYLFEEIRRREAQDNVHYSCFVSFMEIYNERIRDLLNPTNNKKLNILPFNSPSFPNFTDPRNGLQRSPHDPNHYIEQGLLNRRVGVTNMNMRSSRSHAVFTLYLTCEEVQSDITVTRKSQFHLIDLAGSERQTLAGTGGESLKEACFINSSLSALGNVIRSLTHQESHVPYRDSKLTYLLRDSLGGNSLTAIIATVSPADSAALETLSTLRFATDAKMIKNTAVVNEVRFGSVAALQQEIAKLQQELQQCRSSRAVSDSPGFSAYLLRELARCNQTCSELYCRVASLVRERNGWRDSVARLRNELRTKEEVMERRMDGVVEPDDYVKSLKSTVQTLLRQNLDGNTVSVAKGMRSRTRCCWRNADCFSMEGKRATILLTPCWFPRFPHSQICM
ncbi:uncharacterized protein [Blastocystis hominis]|uniref:Kinesin-like protein n=1 Tax=Blastocystis hominis TaxID=12968 RepID=D8LV38_BLAHO|nr:uncharacterized protein [Blastocystis hominis]CBK19677.2 unnamed protein product [Blastocystis hominis]|eukprot:XP_012893725.1 uncharacterized protein [Blastocystis hominis]